MPSDNRVERTVRRVSRTALWLTVAAVGTVVILALVWLVSGRDWEVGSVRPDRPDSIHIACHPQDGTALPTIEGYDAEQVGNAARIVATGVEFGVPERGQIIAVATALQESSLRVLRHGDEAGPDSRGLFQQRDPWGPLEVRLDPEGSARLFYERLVQVPDWPALPLTVAAQAVQNSAFPDHYAKWENTATTIVTAVTGVICAPETGSGPA